MRAFVNRDDLDFGAVSRMTPVQEWELVADGDPRGVIEYPVQVSRFTGVHSLDLHLSGASGGSETEAVEVTFLGLKGEFAERRRQAVETVYESRPVPGDQPRIPGIGEGAHWHS
ncbi:hypothetical protein VOLCADRAFT_97170 [Volvox carteri f. nagariensis]|uniref:PITH domain-containing protein n=1 Tax=Volvox carteri f. nagariensis TaxID=3068 RepID=D8UC23_VOLCA|nr:uncharacterized protein VOLCADRAFT_97170 [Volvox carteri f. nagariensis]EFJ42720.1 hypothetical protein VOLCADRAFT_97170 [Volvox carteri f. nagariensis]|eukprot:XP_002956181.1 hypothetical protein VOLCADRAFT_97170 [Volvox carteri f. nagariensis]